MPSCQRQPFIEEQGSLIGKVLVPGFGVHSAHATVPIVFQMHQKYKGRAFLPIIVRYNFNKLTNVLRLRVLYVDVTSATKLDDEKGYYICALTGNRGIDLSALQSPIVGSAAKYSGRVHSIQFLQDMGIVLRCRSTPIREPPMICCLMFSSCWGS